MNSEAQLQVVEDEWYVVRYSGETPEIAYNSAIYYLTRAVDGPAVELSEKQVAILKQAAIDRFTEIVLRDLDHENCSKSIYRGIQRSIINYRRFCKFCLRQHLTVGEVEAVRSRASESLRIFLDRESELLQQGDYQSVINCSFQDLQSYARELGLTLTKTHFSLSQYCHSAPA